MTGPEIEATAERIARYARGLGYEATVTRSHLSNSAYVDLVLSTEGFEAELVKIRVSGHDLPPSYGALNGWPAYEVGPHGSGHPDGWAGVVAALAERAGKPIPGQAKAALTIISRRREAEQRKRAGESAAHATRMAKVAEVDAVMQARGLDHLTGKRRKRARSKIREELGYSLKARACQN